MPLADSLVAHWRLDSTAWEDIVGSHNLTPTGSPSAVAGQICNAVSITSNAQKLTAADAPDLEASTSFSLAGWVNLRSKNALSSFIVCKTNQANGGREYQWWYQFGTDTLSFSLFENGLASSARVEYNNLGSPPLNTWIFVAAGYDVPNSKIWMKVNSLARMEVAVTTPPIATSTPLTIGNAGGGAQTSWLDGMVDSVSFWWGRVLSNADCDRLYANGNGLGYPFDIYGHEALAARANNRRRDLEALQRDDEETIEAVLQAFTHLVCR